MTIRSLCLFLVGFSYNLAAQQPPWKHIGAPEGLPDAGITCIHRTAGGTLCLGTHDGIVLMDGSRFERITTSGDPGNQVNPFINCIISDHRGNIWAGSRNAIWRYNPQSRKLTTLIHPWAQVGGVISLTPGPDSAFLLATTNKGFLCAGLRGKMLQFTDSIRFEGAYRSFLIDGNWFYYRFHSTIVKAAGGIMDTLIHDKGILDVIWLPEQHRWLLLTRRGLSLAPRDGGETTPLPVTADWENLLEFPHMYRDSQGDLYIPFKGGLRQFTKKNLQPGSFFHYETGNGSSLGTPAVAFFYDDRLGNLWVSTTGSGLNYISQPPQDLLFLSNAALRCSTVWSIWFDETSSELWLGTDDGLRVGRFDGFIFNMQHDLVPPGARGFAVTGIYPLDNSTLLISTFGHGCWHLDRRSAALRPLKAVNKLLKSKNVYGMARIPDGRILIFTQGEAVIWETGSGRVLPFLPEKTEGHFNLTACNTTKGGLLLGEGTGILGATQGGEFRFLLNNRPGDTSSLGSNVVINITELSDHSILLGTMGGGLCRFNPEKRTFSKIRLVSNPVNIFGILEVSPGNILLTTSKGLCLYRTADGTSSLLNHENKLPFNDFNQFASHSGREFLFAAGEKGLVILRKDAIPSLFRSQETIIVKQGRIITREVVMEPGEQTLELHVQINNALPAKRASFRYQLAGFEPGWHEIKPGHDEVLYNYLPPGKYRLVINANDPQGVMTVRPAEISVTVIPYFWQTLWFRGLAGLVALAALFLLTRYFMLMRLKRRLKKLEEAQKLSRERERISRELHDNVGSQLTYLIAGLEASGYLLEKNQTGKLAGDLQTLQQSARESMQQLRQSIWALNRVEISCSAIAGQLRSWMARVMEPQPAIAWSLDCDPGPDPVLDPLQGLNLFRMIQESVHNVIRHAGPCTLKVIMFASVKILRVEVTDTGTGFIPGRGEGTGMGSLRGRAEEAGAELIIESQPGKGTRIIIQIKLNS